MHSKETTLHALDIKGIKKTTLSVSLASILGASAMAPALAAIPNGTLLNFQAGVYNCIAGSGTPPDNCVYGTNVKSGSFFTMDADSSGDVQAFEKTAIAQHNGIFLGTAQAASGSHSGAPFGAANNYTGLAPTQTGTTANGGGIFITDGSGNQTLSAATEVPGIDEPWSFFANTGMHFTTTGITPVTDDGAGNITLDFSGWRVTWNNIPSINMGTGPVDAAMTCSSATCDATGDTFVIDYAATVPVGDPSGFGGVPYTVHLVGSLSIQGDPPTTLPDSAKTITGNPVNIDVLANDFSADNLDPASVLVVTAATNGLTSVDTTDGSITYTPNIAGTPFEGMDTFDYTVDSGIGITSSPTTVDVDVLPNAQPSAADDPVTTNPVALDNGGGTLTINVLDNDSDTNNAPGLAGGIDVTTVSVTNAVGNAGSCTKNADGTVTYTQTPPSVATTDTCTYTVSDIDTFATPLTSASATITISVTEIVSDWPAVLPAGVIPILAYEPGEFTKFDGNGNPDQSVKPLKSWFSMQISSATLIYTTISPGPDGGFIIGYDQPATGSHTGKPNGTEQPGYSAPWLFFSNTGFDLTRNGGIAGNPDGTLDFNTRYVVTWNAIDVINLGGSSKFAEDLGFATITCSDKPCQDGSTYILEYAAHVEDVPGFKPSGFDGVPYKLYHEGTVTFLDGDLQTSDGNVSNEARTGASGTTTDTGVDLQCVGSCFDYTIDNVTPLSSVSIVLPLSGGVPNNPVWRILDNGVWRDFDTSGSDRVKSAPFIAGGPGMQCPAPGDAAYINLVNGTTVNLGHQCIQLSITDNGLNDLDATQGTISDPSGLGTAGTPVFVDTRTSDNSGCSIAAAPVAPGKRADWWLLAAFLGWLGWNRRSNRTQH